MRTPILLSLFATLPFTAIAQDEEAAAEAPTGPVGVERSMPGPLPERPFQMPAMQRGTLDNGVEVIVVSNHEVPLWNARLILRSHPGLDPEGMEGLTNVTFDMLDEGTKGHSAEELSKATKALGGSVWAGSGRDAASIGASGPTKNIDAILDLWAEVLLKPTFPKSVWTRKQRKRIADLEARRDDPSGIASRVFNKVVWGDAYAGRLTTPEAYEAIATKDMKKLYKQVARANDAVILVGGDVTLDEVLPKLNARLARWKIRPPAEATPAPTPAAFEAGTLYVVDKPGTAQALLRVALPVIDRTASAYPAFYLANTAVGGAFTARINMNLREDKGWTYGARCGISHSTGPSLFTCGTGVQIDKTLPSFKELRREIVEATTSRPVTEDELEFFSSFRVNSFYGAYETPNDLLGELQDIWTYDLPSDWLERWVPSLQAVTVDSANAAFRSQIDPSRIAWFIVGDASQFKDGLAELDLPIVWLDADGEPTQAPEAK